MEQDLLKKILSKEMPADWGQVFTKTTHQTPSAAIDPSKISLPDGYVVVITGAGKGIGEYIAKAFAQAKAGNIIITARTLADLERVKEELKDLADGRAINVSICQGDATDAKSYETIADLISTEYDGRLDCLICNAGGGEAAAWSNKLHDTDTEGFTSNTTLNYLSAYYAAKHLIPLMLNPQSLGKTLINITSGACHMVGFPPFSYNISKLALNRLTEAIAELYAGDGLVAIALHPGAVVTPGVLSRAPFMKDVLPDDIRLCGAICAWIADERPTWMSGRYMDSGWDVEQLKSMKESIVDGDKLKFRMVV